MRLACMIVVAFAVLAGAGLRARAAEGTGAPAKAKSASKPAPKKASKKKAPASETSRRPRRRSRRSGVCGRARSPVAVGLTRSTTTRRSRRSPASPATRKKALAQNRRDQLERRRAGRARADAGRSLADGAVPPARARRAHRPRGLLLAGASPTTASARWRKRARVCASSCELPPAEEAVLDNEDALSATPAAGRRAARDGRRRRAAAGARREPGPVRGPALRDRSRRRRRPRPPPGSTRRGPRRPRSTPRTRCTGASVRTTRGRRCGRPASTKPRIVSKNFCSGIGLRRNAAAPAGRSRATALSTTTGIGDELRIALHRLQHLRAVDERHHHVEHDQVGQLVAARAPREIPAPGGRGSPERRRTPPPPAGPAGCPEFRDRLRRAEPSFAPSPPPRDAIFELAMRASSNQYRAKSIRINQAYSQS